VTRNITPSAAKLVPALRYRDLAAAVEWLCIAFGFEKHRVIAGEDGVLAVAQLSVGANMIMLLPVGGSELDQLMKQPDEVGGAETQSCYLAVEDIDVHYAKAKAAGAQFVLDLKAYDNGGRGFSCRDPEGHIWNFGTYDPWEGNVVAANPPAAEKQSAPRGKRSTVGLMVAMAVVTVVVGIGGWTLATLRQPAPGTQAMRFKAEETRLEAELAATQQRVQEALDRAARSTAELARERSERQAAERAAQQAREELQGRQGAKDASDGASRQLEARLTEERRARQAAERAAQQVREEFQRQQGAKDASGGAARQLEAQLSEERRAKEAADRAAKIAADRVAKERTAKRTAQKATLVVQKQLALARAARQAAEQSAKEAAEQLARERAAREAAERAAKDALAKLNRARGAEKGGALPPGQDRPSRRLSKKSDRTGTNEPMPPLLP
jgi:uncharacterized glyoxalase superfamily protein PhnB